MTDAGAPPGPAARGSALGLRLALAFISVALAAVALMCPPWSPGSTPT